MEEAYRSVIITEGDSHPYVLFNKGTYQLPVVWLQQCIRLVYAVVVYLKTVYEQNGRSVTRLL